MDAAALPQDKEAERIRVETAQRISGETEKHWDDAGSMDLRTKNVLGFAGVQCRIIGTFFLEENGHNGEAPLNLKFGGDISNYYPNRGLKVKPFGYSSQKLKEVQADTQSQRYCTTINFAQPLPSPPTIHSFLSKSF